MEYRVTSRDYLKRARACLDAGDAASLFYAAFELRCGIEARLKTYLEAWDHVSKKMKDGWRINALGRGVERAFRAGEKIVCWDVLEQHTRKRLVCLYYTPVSKRLRKAGEKLGNQLHCMKAQKAADDPFWPAFRSKLEVIADDLTLANMGTLMGPPLRNPRTGHVQMYAELPPWVDPDVVMKFVVGGSFIVDIRYLDILPDAIEPEAIVWDRVE